MTPRQKQLMNYKIWIFLSLTLLLSSVGFTQVKTKQKDGERAGYEMIPLDPPATLSTIPLVDGPLLRGEPMKFSLQVDGAPRPISMWSGRLDYTTTTLTFVSAENMGQDARAAVAVSEPYQLFPGWESRSIAGISLNGWPNGEIAQFTFEVKKQAPDSGSVRLGDHPFIKEKLAHDDSDAFKTFDYQRVLDFSKTMNLPVEDVSAENPAYHFSTPVPKVLYQAD
jgi:hypothetical protein